MRTILLILFISLPIWASSQTSKYHSFPDSNAVWNFNRKTGCVFGQGEESYSIIFSGDTVFNGVTYHKLSRPYIKFAFDGCGKPSWPGYIGSIRQDIGSKKVYFIPPSDSTEHLLYDFNMKVGDSVKGYIIKFSHSANYADTVYAIDSVLVGNSYRKRWWFNRCYELYLIEGLGFNQGLISGSPGCIPDADYFSLTCFKQNGQTLYPNTGGKCDVIKTNISLEDLKKIQVYPNPSATGLFIVNLDNSSHITKLRVVDLFGRTVFLNQSFNKDQLQIQLNHGTYILQVINKNNVVSRKVIVAL